MPCDELSCLAGLKTLVQLPAPGPKDSEGARYAKRERGMGRGKEQLDDDDLSDAFARARMASRTGLTKRVFVISPACKGASI